MSIKIYTKKGDDGSTSLMGGTKVSKSHLRLEAYGTVDELNSHLGLCADYATNDDIRQALKNVQDKLFTIGSLLALDPEKGAKITLPQLHESDCEFLEAQIDTMESQLSPLKSFILPGGNVAVSHLHITRCVCRRAERCCVRLREEEKVDSIIIRYLNRLSDYLFVLARYTGYLLKVDDVIWRPEM